MRSVCHAEQRPCWAVSSAGERPVPAGAWCDCVNQCPILQRFAKRPRHRSPFHRSRRTCGRAERAVALRRQPRSGGGLPPRISTSAAVTVPDPLQGIADGRDPASAACPAASARPTPICSPRSPGVAQQFEHPAHAAFSPRLATVRRLTSPEWRLAGQREFPPTPSRTRRRGRSDRSPQSGRFNSHKRSCCC